jgi:cellulose synthase operon protein YhjQ
MPTLSILSASGGAGRSTLTAGLASVFARSPVWSLAVEFDPQNLLAFHFGASTPPQDGLASRASRNLPWNTAALVAADSTLILPFGEVSAPALIDWERRLIVEPDWLRSRLDSIARPNEAWTFIDTPRWPGVLSRQAIAASDLILVVLKPDAHALTFVDTVRDRLEDKHLLFVINGLDVTRRLQSDIMSQLRRRLGTDLFAQGIHQDEAVPEALAKRVFVEDHMPHAQVVHDLHELSVWIKQQHAALKLSSSRANVG